MAVQITQLGGEISTLATAQTFGQGAAGYANVAPLQGGGFVKVWADGDRKGYYQIFSDNGTPLSPASQIDVSGLYTINDLPSVTSLPGGGFAIAWRSGLFDPLDGIVAKIYAPGGNPLAPAFAVNSQGSYDQLQPDIAQIGADRFIVTWQSGGREINAQIFDLNGATIGSEFLISSTINGNLPKVTSLSNGGFAVSWVEFGFLGSAIYNKAFGPDYVALSPPFKSSFADISDPRLFEPVATSISATQYVLTWGFSSGTSYPVALYGQIFDNDGTASGSTFVVADSVGDVRPGSVVGIGNNRFAVTWDQSGSIKAQIFDGSGQKIGSELNVKQNVSENIFGPEVTTLANGHLVFSWKEMSPPVNGVNSVQNISKIYDINNSPSFGNLFPNTNVDFSIAENSVAIANLLASDVDANTVLNYSISGGADAALFQIDATTGALSLKSPADFETPADVGANNVYNVEVQVSDGALTDARVVFVSITNVNEAPLITAGDGAETATISLLENTSVVTTVTAADFDANTTLTCAISGGTDAALFDIDAATGALSFKAAPNFEAPADAGANNVYDVEVQVSDGTLIDTQAIAVSVTNVNEAPLVAAAIPDQAISEDSAWSYQGPAGTFTEPDGDLLTYSAAMADGSSLPEWLGFDAATRTFSGTPPLNFNGNISLTVTASDGTSDISDSFNLEISPLNDAPAGQANLLKRVETFTLQPAAEIQILAENNVEYTSPSVANLNDGGWIVTWSSSGSKILAQRYSADGIASGDMFEVNTPTNVFPSSPSVSGCADGGWVIAWQVFDPQSGGQVYFRRFDANGTALGAAFQVTSNVLGGGIEPSVAALSDGGWVVSWMAAPGLLADSGGEVLFQKFDSFGVPASQITVANTYADNNQSYPAVSALPDGGWIITWSSEGQDSKQLGPSGTASGVFGQRYSANSEKIGQEFQVNTYGFGAQVQPNVTALSDGGWLVTWSSELQDGNQFRFGNVDSGIYGQRYAPDGVPVGTEFKINTAINLREYEPVVVGLNDGGWIVAWSRPSSTTVPNGYTDVFAQRFSSNGQKVGDEVKVNTFDAGYQHTPTITAMNDGGWLILWENRDPLSGGIYGQRFDAAGNRNDLIKVVSYQELTASAPTEKDTIVIDSSLVSDADGLGQISWQWQRSDNAGLSWIDIVGASNNSYALNASDIGNLVRARGVYTDAQGTLETIYSVQSGPILNVNDAPVLSIPLADQTISEDTAWSYQVSADRFSDVDGDALTFSASLGDGSALPAWLSFDPATRTFAGTPPQNFNGNVALTVTASDGALQATDSFNLSVQAVNDAPSGSLQILKSTGVAISNPMPEFSLPLLGAQQGVVPAIAPLIDGGWVTAWTFGRAGGSSLGTQRYAPNGDPVGSPSVIETGIDVSLSEPKIAPLPDGGWVTSWLSYSYDANTSSYNGSSIFAQRFGRDGIPIGERLTVIDENGGLNGSPQIFKNEPQIATLSDGGWVFTWTMDVGDGLGNGIYGHKFNADGLSSGGIFRIDSITLGRDEASSVTGLKNGGWIVTWGSDYGYSEIVAQVYAADGTPVGGNTYVDNQVFLSSETVPIVTALDDGGYVIAWSSFSYETNVSNIFGQRFSADGLRVGDRFTVVSNVGAPSDIITLPDGGWLITWGQYSDLGGYNTFATKRYSADGSAVGEIQQYDGQIGIIQYPPQLAALRNGGWIAMWQNYDSSTNTYTIKGQQFDVNGNAGLINLDLAVPLVTDFVEGNYLYANADMITDPEGVGVIFWQWQRKVNGGQNWQDIVGANNDRYMLTDVDIGSVIRLRGQYTDSNGAVETVYSPVSPPIAFLNDAPTLATAIANQSATEDAAFSFVVPVGSFADVDPGDVLTLSASLADGSPLPAWLSFDAATMTFSGTPLRGDVGAVSVRVTATDIGGLSVSDLFDLAIAAETIAPTAQISDNVAGTAIGAIAYTVTFSEPVTGLAAADFSVANGSVVSIEGSGQTYIVNVSPSANFEGMLALSLNAAAVLDKAGNTNAAVFSEFQQVDTRAPVLTTITPVADSVGVAVATNITLAYSEGVRAGTGVIELRTAAGVLVESFNVATSNRLSFTGSTLTIDPTASLNGATQYRLTVPQGAVLDTAGNAAAALATYAFTTQSLANIINGTAVANTLNGTAGDDEIYGLGGNDTLNGNAGNDLLDGGTGADRMAGGAGNDIYVVDNAADTVTEAANAGIDLVRTTRNNYTLATNVENLTYVGDATFTGTGNGLANRIQGGSGNDVIDGGAGADTMIGGIGNDRYVVDNVGDVVVEQAGEGTDMVTASMSYVLGANVENLTLSGNAAINGTGNAVANIITGNNGANILRGGGGADTLNGGAGTDTAAFEQAVANYAIDHSGTAIIVSDLVGGEGTDTLTAIETLSFLGSSHNVVTGTGAANVITGAAGSQAIFGLGGNDTINGGAGNDIVIGGLGNDNISMASDTGGRDFIDGGAGEDTFTLLTAAGAENFVIYTRAAAQQAIAGLVINPNSEIVVTRNGSVIAELDNVEEIVVSSLRVTSPAGANGGTVAGDTVQVVGDFNQTSLNFNTIRVNGTNASDTVDITGLQSEHRIVFTGNGGTDNVVGNLRPQDIFVTDSVAATTSLTASLAASAATNAATSAASSAASVITCAITSTSASLQALKQAAVVSAEPVTDDGSTKMHRLYDRQTDDQITSLLRDMFDDSKSGSLFRQWDAIDKRQEAKIDDHPGLRHDAGKDDIKLYDGIWSDVLIRRPDSWHAEFEHLM